MTANSDRCLVFSARTLVLLAVLGFPTATLQAQAVFAINVQTASPDGSDAKHPFLLPAQSNDIREALSDFDQYAKRAAWEKAFESYKTVRDGDRKRLTPDGNGFYLPLDRRLHQMLALLPPAGRDAFRVFYDPEAKKLLDESSGVKEIENLQKIVAGYLVTSVGDQAADRLGDLYFQRGEMDKAAAAWQTILDYLPDSALNRTQLLVKAATALARANRWEEFARLEQEVKEKHAGEAVIVGGKSVDASEQLETLAKSRSAATGPAANDPSLPADVRLAGDAKPLWQFRFLSEKSAKQITQMVHDWGWGRVPFTDMIPMVALDSTRAYMNYVGYQCAVDLKSGKLLWRSDKFNDLPDKLRQNQNVVVEQYGLAATDKWLISIAREPKQLGVYNAVFNMASWDRANGKLVWNTDSISQLKTWNLSGRPYIADDKIYICGTKQEQHNELNVLAFSATDGRLLWNTIVGANQADQRNYYNRRSAEPRLLLAGDTVYVDSNTGAVAALDRDNGVLKWGFAYQAETPDNNYYWNTPLAFEVNNTPLFADGVLYVKGMRSSRLVAIEVSGPRLRWQRPVPKSSVLVAIDGDHLLMGGEEISRIRLSDQKLEWATRIPVGTPQARPIVTRNQVLQFTPRGIFVLDKKTGDRVALVRGGDLDSLGGALFPLPNALVTVSNLAITAYPLDSNQTAALPPQAPQPAAN